MDNDRRDIVRPVLAVQAQNWIENLSEEKPAPKCSATTPLA
jgi:hypothetical protein